MSDFAGSQIFVSTEPSKHRALLPSVAGAGVDDIDNATDDACL